MLSSWIKQPTHIPGVPINSHLDPCRHHHLVHEHRDCCCTATRTSYLLYGVLQGSPAPITVHKLLFAEGDQLVCHDGIDALNSASGGEGPTGAALRAKQPRSVENLGGGRTAGKAQGAWVLACTKEAHACRSCQDGCAKRHRSVDGQDRQQQAACSRCSLLKVTMVCTAHVMSQQKVHEGFAGFD